MKYIGFLLVIWISFFSVDLNAQSQPAAWGFSFKNDLYTRYVNPPAEGISNSSGSALLNFGIGPKAWFGSESFAISPEAFIMYSPFAMSLEEFKGLGALSFPVMLKFEFGGLNNLSYGGSTGFALGVGYQWSRTELHGLTRRFKELGIERNMYRTIVLEADYGFGISGFDIHFYVRYGFNHDLKANTLNAGIGYDFNIPMLKKTTDPDF